MESWKRWCTPGAVMVGDVGGVNQVCTGSGCRLMEEATGGAGSLLSLSGMGVSKAGRIKVMPGHEMKWDESPQSWH